MRTIKEIALVMVLIFVVSGIYATLLIPTRAQAVNFGGINTVYVPRIAQCPEHIWVVDFRTGTARALTDFGSTIYDNGNVFTTGSFVLGSHNSFPNVPCLIQVTPPIFLPYPLYNINYEGTS